MGRQRGAGRKTEERWGYSSALELGRRLPQHFRQIADTPKLIEEERDSLAQCEAALESLKVAFWAAGKALEIVREGRLYREVYPSFDAYCWERWGLGRDYADRLIRAWPVAEELLAADSEAGRRLNESQVRVLLPVAARHGSGAAVVVYRTVQEAGSGAVTADALKEAVRSLPKSQFDEERAVASIRAALGQKGEGQPGQQNGSSGGGTRGNPSSGGRRRVGEEGAPPEMPWDSPESLNSLLRQHMAIEDRRTLGKLLMED